MYELMSSIFYDWGYSYGEQEIQYDKKDNIYWINKTTLYTENGKHYLSYKMELLEISEEVYNKFALFFDKYDKNKEFESFLTIIQDHWFKKPYKVFKSKNSFNINNSILIEIKNDRVFISEKKENNVNEEELNPSLKEEILFFFSLF